MPEQPRILISELDVPPGCEAVLYAAGDDGEPDTGVREAATMRRVGGSSGGAPATSRVGQAPAGMVPDGSDAGVIVLQARPAVWGLRKYGVAVRNPATGEESALATVQVFVDAEPVPPTALEFTGDVVGDGQFRFALKPGVLR